MNVTGLIPEARSIARRVAAVYMEHTAPWFIGLIVHGSAVKGGVISGCSDIDFQLYLQTEAFSWDGQLPLKLGLAIRRGIGDINPAPFRYIQCYAHSGQLQEGWVGPVPGAYHLIAGRLPIPEATAHGLRASAQKALAELNPAPRYIMGKLLGPGQVRMARAIRLLCTQVWPALFQVLTLQSDDPVAIWNLTKGQAIQRLPRDSALSATIRGFYQSVEAYYPAETSLDGALAVIENGVAFLEAVKRSWDDGDL